MDDARIKRLKEQVALLPREPGIYRYLNREGTVIYVGKAKDLRKRVSSYFLESHQRTGSKTKVLVRNIDRIEHIVVASEADAFLLENNLIKELKPRYNIMLKDDKTYPWMAIRNEHFPRVVSTRRIEHDGSRYFGPYSSVYVQKQLLELIRRTYTIRTCALDLSPAKIRQGRYAVCLEYHIGNCKGPCTGKQSEEEYDANIAVVADILKGNLREVVERLEKDMSAAAAEMKFEQAHKVKQQIEGIRNFQSKTVIVSSSAIDLDVFFPIMDGGAAYCNFTRIKNGAVISSFTVEMKLGIEEEPADVLTYAISRIGEQVEGGLQREIIAPFQPVPGAFPGHEIHVPRRGDKVKLLEFAEKNCKLYRLEKLKYIEKTDPRRHTERIVSQMQKDLRLAEPPYHIECFDNSNIQGTNPVAACVVFRGAKPAKKEYRHYNIKTVVGANDFASMEEVVTRRYTRLTEEGGDLPQLIVIDGGKGQLGFAYNTLKKLGLEKKIAIIGLAKRLEEVFFPHDSTPHYLDKSSETLKVLMHIRDEAHRFGITFHRQKRSLAFIKTELESIPGLGRVSAEKLLKKFRTVSKIRSAPAEELAAVIGRSRAEAVKAHFEHADTPAEGD